MTWTRDFITVDEAEVCCIVGNIGKVLLNVMVIMVCIVAKVPTRVWFSWISSIVM